MSDFSRINAIQQLSDDTLVLYLPAVNKLPITISDPRIEADMIINPTSIAEEVCEYGMGIRYIYSDPSVMKSSLLATVSDGKIMLDAYIDGVTSIKLYLKKPNKNIW